MGRLSDLGDRVRLARLKLRRMPEEDRATAYWAGLADYHEQNDRDPVGLARSRWLAEDLFPSLGITSLLEVGTNSGRNLAAVKAANPAVRVKGIDVNEKAIAYAQGAHPEVEFELQDANRWLEPHDGWDAILTMSVLDHIPDEAIDALAANMVATASRYVVCVELWDGSEGERGPYKYSRATRALFERHGARTMRWEQSPGQYDTEQSLLWLYVGEVGAEPG
jgi:SAM-dependent methyltransferase